MYNLTEWQVNQYTIWLNNKSTNVQPDWMTGQPIYNLTEQ